jgi:hypothetical protein
MKKTFFMGKAGTPEIMEYQAKNMIAKPVGNQLTQQIRTIIRAD